MKLRKLLMCLLAAAVVSGSTAVSAMAAETDTISATVDATQEELTDSTAEETKVAEDADTTEESEVKEEVTEEVTEEAAEETEAAEEAEAEDSEKEEAEEEKKPVKKAKKAKKASYTKAELRLLASLIYCEAGSEPYAGKLAVGIVVMNREESSRFPNSLNGVVYQKYQFGPARNGSLNAALKRYDSGRFTSQNEKDCIKAAKAALSGEKNVNYKGKEINMKSFLFFSGRVSGARLTIANHQFK